MALFSAPQPHQQQQQSQPPQPQPQPQSQPQPESKPEEDYAVADSFINFDYVPEIEETLEPIVSGSAWTRVVKEHGAGAGAGGADKSVNVGALGCCSRISEGIEQISLAGGSGVNNDDHADDRGSKSENSESKSGASSSSSSHSSFSAKSSDVKMEERDGDRSEPEEGEIIESDRDDDDDEEEEGLLRSNRSKNELEIVPVVNPVNVTLRPHHQMLPVGVVVSIFGAKVLVEGVESHQPLNGGSILWISERRTPLGLIDEILGPVKQPYYVVRYNSEDQVPEGIYHGALISFVPEFATVVLNSNADLFEKGYDASGENDQEFSDDEKEAEYMSKLRMAKRGSSDQNVERRRKKGKRSPPEEPLLPTPAFPVAPAAPLYGDGQHSTFTGNPQGQFAPTAPLLDHGQHSPFSGHTQGPFVPAAPLHDHGFTGNAQGLLAPTPPLHDHGQHLTFSGHTQGPFVPAAPLHDHAQGPYGATTVVPPFTPANANPPIGIWTNAATIPQPQPAALPIGFPTNDIPWFPPNSQIPQQWPLQAVPFQQQLNPNQVLPPPPATMFPGAQPNILAQQAMYPQGAWGQNQMPFGLNMNSSFPQIQHPPIYSGLQGSSSNGFQPQTNHSLGSNSIPFNHHAPHQFHPGSSADRGRRPFHHHGGRRGWNPAR
ncbi:hypothetical protein PIB30_042263 [Stylosanthes scabra]|uniref:H/ACA ribonucleoprotein complex non-core subunit NAF1 n=1 Tax=Stylosanthes scabra TaxID=79078 RepID=A0ABU6SFA3_9FABA|nr:hypothetical protein [Stylosanthes scabra]